MKIRTLSIAIAALALSTAGCRTHADYGVHVVQPRDIPVPAGMRLKTRNHQSNSLEVGDYRFVNLVYEGRTPPMQVAAYLLERMPQHSYRLVNQEKADNGQETLLFERGTYTSECTVRSNAQRTRLEIRLRTNPKL